MNDAPRKGWVILPRDLLGNPYFSVPTFSDSADSGNALVLGDDHDAWREDRYIKVWNVRRSAEAFRRSFLDADQWIVARVDVSPALKRAGGAGRKR